MAGGPQNIAVTSPGVTHGYWHVQPAVANGQHVNQGAVLGHVAPTWGHVHFAERTPTGPYLNPLRPGALAPFTKQDPPTVDRILAERNGQPLNPNALTGMVDQPILGKEAKLATLQRLAAEYGLSPADAVTVGDGANDLPMLKAAGLGVAFHAKPAVAAEVPARIDHGDLTALLYLQGYRRADFVERTDP